MTFRQVQHLFDRIATTNYDRTRKDEARFDNLDALLNKIGTAGAHEDVKLTTSIAIDGSDIPSWGTDRYHFVFDKNGVYVGNEKRKTDPDAHWRTKTDKTEKNGKKSILRLRPHCRRDGERRRWTRRSTKRCGTTFSTRHVQDNGDGPGVC